MALRRTTPRTRTRTGKMPLCISKSSLPCAAACTRRLTPLPNRDIVTLHEAFPYFAEEFGLTIVGTVQREPDSQPSARELADTIRLIRSTRRQGRVRRTAVRRLGRTDFVAGKRRGILYARPRRDGPRRPGRLPRRDGTKPRGPAKGPRIKSMNQKGRNPGWHKRVNAARTFSISASGGTAT